jgi:anti-sigma regulatory factor (Ser/Thr protein kinase)
MKVETRTALPRRFAHRAATYRDPTGLLSVAVPIVEHAMRRDTPVVLIASPGTERLIGEATEADRKAGGLVCLPGLPEGLRRSGQTVAVRRAAQLRELTDRSGPVVVLVEHDARHSLLDEVAWVEAEAATNLAVAGMPVTMTCLFRDPANPASATALRQSHPQLLGPDAAVLDNPDHREPAEVLADHPVAAPPTLGPPDREFTFTPWQLTDLRAAVAEVASVAGMRRERAEDFMLAVNEVAGNAVEHGYGTGLWQAWSRGHSVVCEVHDSGSLARPLPGLSLPHPARSRGRGIWIARQLCDLLHVWSDGDGTHVRIEATRS